MSTTLQPNAEAAHDASMGAGKKSLLLGLRAVSLVLAGMGSTGDETLPPEATDLLEQAMLSDDPQVTEALRGIAHQLSTLTAGNSVYATALLAVEHKLRAMIPPRQDIFDLLVEQKIRSLTAPSLRPDDQAILAAQVFGA